MKQTNNAIKFLMAQYRAIFKHAYLKGLVSAAILTAGLATGATANAAGVLDIGSGSAQLSGNETYINADDTTNLAINTSQAWNANVTLNGASSGAGSHSSLTIINSGAGAEVTISGSGTLTLQGDSDTSGSFTLQTGSGSNNTTTLALREINVKSGGLLTINADSGCATVGGKYDTKNWSVINLESGGAINLTGSGTNSVYSTLDGKLNATGGDIINETNGNKITAFGINQNLNITATDNDDNTEDKSLIISLTDNSETADNEGLLQITKGNIILEQGKEATSGAGILEIQKGTLELIGDTVLFAESGDTTGEVAGVIIKGSGTAANLTINQNILTNFISGKDVDSEATEVKGGVVVSGSGTLVINPTESNGVVDLYTLTKDGAVKILSGTDVDAGEINVNGGTIEATNLAISNSGANLNLSGANLKADTLALGSETLAFADSANIKFTKATVGKSLIVETKPANDAAFTLGGNVDLAAYTTTTNDSDTVYSESSGQISGADLSIEGTTLEVKAGNWTAEQALTVSSSTTSGNLFVSADSNKKLDSTLVLNNGLKFNLDTSNNVNVTVTGAGSNNNEYVPSNNSHYLALLDLTSGITVSGNSGKGIITATSGGIIKLDGENLTNIMAQAGKTAENDYTNLQFVAQRGGKFEVDGSLTLNYTPTSNDDIQSMLNIESGGIIDISDSFSVSLSEIPNGNSDTAGADLGFGINGELRTANFTINNSSLQSDGKTKTESVYLTEGTFNISSSLSTNNKNLVIGDNGAQHTTTGVFVYLTTDEADGKGTIDVDNLELSSDNTTTELLITQGQWDASNTNFILTSGDMSIGDSDSTAKLTAKGLEVSGGTLTVNSGSSASFSTLDLTGASAGFVDIYGNVSFSGIAKDTTNAPTGGIVFGSTEKVLKVNNNATLSFGENATYNAIYASKDENGVTLQSGYKLIDLQQGGTVILGFKNNETFSVTQLQDLKKDLFGTESIDGILNIGNASIGDLKYEEDTDVPTITWDNLKPVVEVATNVTDNKLSQAVVTEITSDAKIQGVVGSLQAAEGTNQITITNSTYLGAAQNNNNFFASNAEGTEAVTLVVENNSNLTLINNGSSTSTAGDIDLGDDSSFTTNGSAPIVAGEITGGTGAKAVFNAATTAKTIDVENVDVQNSLTATDITSTHFASAQGTTTTATNELAITDTFSAEGNVNANTLSLTDTLTDFIVRKDAVVNVDTLMTDSNSSSVVIQVGQDSAAANTTTGEVARESSTGYMFINKASLNGATLFGDPDYNDATTLITVKQFGNNTISDVGTIDGSVAVGKNAAIGLGTDEAGLKAAIANYQRNGALLEDKYGAILYLAESATLSDLCSIAINSDADVTGLAGTQSILEYDTGLTADLALSDNSALLINMNAFSDKDGNATTALHFASKDAVVNSLGGEIVLTGEYDATSLINIFSDEGNIGDTDPAANTGVKLVGSDITVRTENGLMVGTITKGDNVGQNIEMKVDTQNINNILTGASSPVRQSIVAYGNGYNGDTLTEESQLHSGVFKDGNEIKYFNAVLNQSLSQGNGQTAEQVARLGIYGGSVQAALSAGASTSDAVAARMGMGAQNGSITFADNGQGAGLWVSPIYKNHDSDGFGTQGLSYGTDMDFYGVALGGDFTMANGFRAGAAFNVGSGDADGQGAASGVSNDFDYYGFSIYGAYTMDKLSVVGDVAYTVVDNDVSANTALGKVSSSMDSSNLSVGVTGQYTLSLSAVDVVPHAGLRYTYVDMDDYTVKGDADLAHYAGDSMSIFSIPVGVTFSKDIVAGAWTVKPAFDVTLTANMGDDSIDGSVTWAGVENLKTNLESEVVDSFTYGATLGVSAKTGNFSLGFGVNYTGASNADEYGVNANARFVF